MIVFFAKKIKGAAATTKRVKEIGANLQAKFQDSRTMDEFVQKVLDAARQGLNQAGIRSAVTLRDEAAFASAIESAYSHLPLPYRIIVPKKLFAKLMRSLKDRLIFKGERLEFDKETRDAVVLTLKSND
jgi:GAF domain-containing protein